jgi:myo-inositol-1(or 4)-monophosphatase
MSDELSFIKEALSAQSAFIKENYANRRSLTVNTKAHANDLLTAVDIAVQKAIVSRIQTQFPGDAILGEESGMSVYPDKAPPRLWAIDPIDGTSNFVRGLFPEFGVSLALLKDGTPSAGGVLMPIHDELFLAETGKGAVRNGVPLHVAETADLEHARVDLDFDGPAWRAATIRATAAILQKAGQIRAHACCVVGFCGVASGELDAYIVRGLNAWDLAAGMVIVEEAGGTVTRFDGSPLRPLDARRDVLVTNGRIHPLCLAELAE